MRQGSLSSWCGVAPARTHFVLDEDHVASFVDAPPAGATHVTDTLVKGDALRVTLSLWRVNSHTERKPFRPIVKVADKSLLASMVQKAVRRGRADVAASAALELSHTAPISLARRLIIVAIEDASPDSNLIAVVWLMLAWSCKSADIVEDDVCYLIKYAEALAVHATRVPIDSHAPIAVSDKVLWEHAQSRRDDVSLALIARSTFGGMACDMRMLLRATESSLVNAPRLALSTVDVPRLTASACMLEAADFHCEPSMLEVLATLHCVSPESVRAAIWQNASSCNFRSYKQPSLEAKGLWLVIRADAEAIQRRRIARAFAASRDSDLNYYR